MNLDPQFDISVSLARGDVTCTERDVALLRAIATCGSLNAATESLGRSYSHAYSDLRELEDAFGPLVERRRGGSEGGGSELTATGERLLATYDRLGRKLADAPRLDCALLTGEVREREGRLVSVETEAGVIRAVAPEETGRIHLLIPSGAVTVASRGDTGAGTSAVNRFSGTVTGVHSEGRVHRVEVDVGAEECLRATLTDEEVEAHGVERGQSVSVSIQATSIRSSPG